MPARREEKSSLPCGLFYFVRSTSSKTSRGTVEGRKRFVHNALVSSGSVRGTARPALCLEGWYDKWWKTKHLQHETKRCKLCRNCCHLKFIEKHRGFLLPKRRPENRFLKSFNSTTLLQVLRKATARQGKRERAKILLRALPDELVERASGRAE